MTQTGCEFVKCPYACRGANGEAACNHDGPICIYRGDADAISELQSTLAAKDRELAESSEALLSVLEERPSKNGEYIHLVVCSGDRTKPPGSPGCICLPSKKALHNEISNLKEINRVQADFLFLNKQEIDKLQGKIIAKDKELEDPVRLSERLLPLGFVVVTKEQWDGQQEQIHEIAALRKRLKLAENAYKSLSTIDVPYWLKSGAEKGYGKAVIVEAMSRFSDICTALDALRQNEDEGAWEVLHRIIQELTALRKRLEEAETMFARKPKPSMGCAERRPLVADECYKRVGSIETRTTEECSELIKILCKVRRFGWQNYHPDDPTKRPNYLLVLDEIEDVENCISELKREILNYCAAVGALSISKKGR